MSATLITEARSPLADPVKNEIERPLRVCFVCTGNTCRSPMAEAVANALARAEATALSNTLPEGMRDCVSSRLEAYSAGLYPIEGDPIAANAVTALEEADVQVTPERDYHCHRAAPLTEDTVSACDLLVGMSGSHVMELLMRYPQAAQKITCMPQAISDPFGGDLERYRSCLAEITEGVRALFFREVEG